MRDNAGQRVLNARKTLTRGEHALANTIGQTLPDGAQCYVIEAQANYRWLLDSVLAPDGVFVLEAAGPGDGRWVRESGLTGFAMLHAGTIGVVGFRDDSTEYQDFLVGGYKSVQLVQFALDGDSLIYTGAVPRLAIISAAASLEFDRGSGRLGIVVSGGQRTETKIELAGPVTTSRIAALEPGAHVSLMVSGQAEVRGTGSLHVVLA